MSHLVNLQVIDLSRNHLTGGVENCLDHKNLKMLYLNNNLLTCSLPSIVNLPNIERIALQKNNINGALPDLSKCSLLVMAMFYGNRMLNGVGSFFLPQALQFLHLYDTGISNVDLERLQALNVSCTVYKN